MSATRDSARAAIIEVGRRLYARGLVCAAEGNISLRLGPDEIVATAAGVHKGYLTPDQVVVIDRHGTSREAGARPVSTEIAMHLKAYELRPDIGAVVHAHPPVATSFAVAGIPLAQCVMPEVVVSLGGVPIAGYGTPGTEAIPNGLAELYPHGNAFLLANHGAVCLGRDVFAAFDTMEMLEHAAQVLHHARALGPVNVLTPAQVADLLAQRRASGVTSPVFPCDVCSHCPEPPTVAVRHAAGEACGRAACVCAAQAPAGDDVRLATIVAEVVAEALRRP